MYIHGMRRIYVQPWIWAAWIFVGRPIHTDDDENGFRIMSVRNSKHFSKDAFHNKSQLNRKCSRCFWSHLSGTTHTTLFSGRTIGRNFTITCCRWENVDHLMRRRKKNKIKKNVHVKYSKRNLRCSVDDYDVPNNREYPFMKWTKFIFCSSVRWFRCVIQYATGKINKRKNIITYSESRDPMRPASFACASIWFSSSTQRHFNCVRTARSYDDDDDDDAFLRWTKNSSTTFPDTFYFHISFLIVCHVHGIPLGLFGR